MPELELTEPEEDCSPEVELLDEDVELAVEVEVDPVDAVALDMVPGTVVALMATKTPSPAKATIATPAVTWLIKRCAPSLAEILDWTDCVLPMAESSPPGLKRFWELAESWLRKVAQRTPSVLAVRP